MHVTWKSQIHNNIKLIFVMGRLVTWDGDTCGLGFNLHTPRYRRPGLCTAPSPALTRGHFNAEHSGLQTEPQMGLKQFMTSGLFRHVLAYTWFL